ncbi:hypothetical protein PROFUN_04715 [Planoprotostelium fungivorum]|uniref:Uncharacterized protein n=1 Tax=Planoprotostelium fungivorum TaxID=1890364 RepID=A0A2P6NG04_9EUKA|nr:hypothetical protein PROFUN_04715 [Planoprotostelium fungivorum]
MTFPKDITAGTLCQCTGKLSYREDFGTGRQMIVVQRCVTPAEWNISLRVTLGLRDFRTQAKRCQDLFCQRRDTNIEMKRQRVTDEVNTEERSAFAVLTTDERPTMVIKRRSGSSVGEIILQNQAAEELLTQVVSDESLYPQFAAAVDSVYKTGQSAEAIVNTLQHTIKTKSATLSNQQYVIVTAKKMKEAKRSWVQLQHDAIPPRRNLFEESPEHPIGPLINTVEQDLISRTLGTSSVFLLITSELVEPGIVTFFAVNPGVAARYGYSNPLQIRGKTSQELGLSPPEVMNMARQHRSHYDPNIQRASYSYDIANVTMLCENKLISPGVNLSVLFALSKPEPTLPAPPKSILPPVILDQRWNNHHWDVFLEDLLNHAKDNAQYTSPTRQKLPAAFFENPNCVYCYVYQGAEGFLPSGQSDGFRWKSSCSTTSQGCLKKRYFYASTADGKKLRRRVMWTEKIPNLFIVEYRHISHCGLVQAEYLLGPSMMDWPVVVQHLCAQKNHQVLRAMNEISQHFDLGAMLSETPAPDEPHEVISYVNGILSHWATDHHNKNIPLL